MLPNRTELSGSGGKPVEVDHTIDHSDRIPGRPDALCRET
jgi:hypothetical protein